MEHKGVSHNRTVPCQGDPHQESVLLCEATLSPCGYRMAPQLDQRPSQGQRARPSTPAQQQKESALATTKYANTKQWTAHVLHDNVTWSMWRLRKRSSLARLKGSAPFLLFPFFALWFGTLPIINFDVTCTFFFFSHFSLGVQL